jgi:hypothetical protein
MIGLSGGARSKPCFNWVRNLLKKHTQDQIDDFDVKQCSAFAFFWNLLRHRLPLEVLADFDKWMLKDMMPRMSPEWKDLAKKGSYSVDLPGRYFTFDDVELAPPAGVMAHNYSRYSSFRFSI